MFKEMYKSAIRASYLGGIQNQDPERKSKLNILQK